MIEWKRKMQLARMTNQLSWAINIEGKGTQKLYEVVDQLSRSHFWVRTRRPFAKNN